MRPQQGKEIILKNTLSLMLLKGYDGVSISDIQRQTGMSRGLLYHYFGSKEELFRAAGVKLLEDMFAVSYQNEAGLTLPAMIRETVRLNKECQNSNAGTGITMVNYDMLFYRMIDADKYLHMQYLSIRQKELDAWQRAARKSMEAGEIHNILPPETIARHFVSILDGSWISAVDGSTPAQYAAYLKDLLNDYYKLLVSDE